MRFKEGDIFLRLTGGDLTGALILANGVGLQAKSSGGTAYELVRLETNNHTYIGDTGFRTRIGWTAQLLSDHGASTFNILTSENRLLKLKTADETVNNSTTLQNDNDLLVAVQKSTEYLLRLHLEVDSNTTADFKFALILPSGATLIGTVFSDANPSLSAVAQVADLASGHAVILSVNPTVIEVVAKLIMSTTAGNVQLQWAQNTADVSDTIVREESYLEIVETGF